LSLPVIAIDLGNRGCFVKRVVLASDQEEPWKMAIDVAEEDAEDERRETKSARSDQEPCIKGKQKATPGYDSTYVPRSAVL